MTHETRNDLARAHVRTMANHADFLFPRFPDTARMPKKRQGQSVRRYLKAQGHLSSFSKR